MSKQTHRVRLVVTGRDAKGPAVQIETKPMTKADANRVAAEAVGRGIPAAVHKA